MESLQGPINHSCFFVEHLECIEEQGLTRLEEELEEDKMPFLQMLQSVETSASHFPVKDTSFQALLKLQHLKSNSFCYMSNNNNMSNDFIDFESVFVDYSHCLQLHDASPVKSEAQEQAPICPQEEECVKETHHKGKPVERIKKRKRARPSKNKEEVETQRMTHIAVERNRRRQMNDHLNVLRSLMPNSYIQRGDQASIVGGAIDFVKELEQLLQSLEAQKRTRSSTPEESYSMSSSSNCSSTSSSSMSQFGHGQLDQDDTKNSNNNANSVGDEVRAENKSECADVEATVIQTHVNLKIQCPKRPGQLLKAIVALEELGLSILHLNVTSSYEAALYSFNLQIEDECKLGSADEIAGAVNQIFRIINGSLNN